MPEQIPSTLQEVTAQPNDLAATLGLKIDPKVKHAMMQRFLALLTKADELLKRDYPSD